MPAMHRYLALVAIAAASGLGTPLWAQGIAPCALGGGGSINYGVTTRSNAPFTAVAKTAFEQKLADGNAIHTVTQTRQARDSAGRTMSEMAQGCERGEDGQLHPVLNINVNDPVAKISMSWQRGGMMPKVVHVFHQQAIVRPQMTPEEQATLLQQQKLMQAQQPARNKIHTEQLGSKTISGVTAEGTRTTQTIPAGEEGNDLPLEVVRETWRSKELGLTLMAVNDDPRRGKTTFEYEELNLGEPDPALFAAPADYKVEEIHPNNEVR